MTDQSTQRKHASVLLCPQQIPRPDPCSNPGRSGGKPAANRLSCGTASEVTQMQRHLAKGEKAPKLTKGQRTVETNQF
jgi:hypothetical protein